jgi:hypothetical protein
MYSEESVKNDILGGGDYNTDTEIQIGRVMGLFDLTYQKPNNKLSTQRLLNEAKYPEYDSRDLTWLYNNTTGKQYVSNFVERTKSYVNWIDLKEKYKRMMTKKSPRSCEEDLIITCYNVFHDELYNNPIQYIVRKMALLSQTIRDTEDKEVKQRFKQDYETYKQELKKYIGYDIDVSYDILANTINKYTNKKYTREELINMGYEPPKSIWPIQAPAIIKNKIPITFDNVICPEFAILLLLITILVVVIIVITKLNHKQTSTIAIPIA